MTQPDFESGKPLTPYDWLLALILNLQRGELHVLDGFRTAQDQHGSAVQIEWTLLGEVITINCSWPRDYHPTGPLQLRGPIRETVIRSALGILSNALAVAIAKVSA